LIDSTSGIVGAIRVANMPKVLWEVWREPWRKSVSIEDYTRKYAEWIKTLWQRKTMELWNTATPSGVFGERYGSNLSDYGRRRSASGVRDIFAGVSFRLCEKQE
jgi:hypothetical protein